MSPRTILLVLFAGPVFLSFAGLAGVSQRKSTPAPLCFIDEAATDPTFFAFRERLRRVVRDKDAVALSAMVADDIRLIQESGKAHFEDVNRLSDKTSMFWHEFATLLRLGGRFVSDGVFCAPYVSCPGPDNQDMGEAVVLGKHVPVFDKAKGKPVAWLACDVVRVSGDQLPPRPTPRAPNGWTEVFLNSGRWAVIEDKNLREVGDYFAHFQKRGGKWQLVLFMAGD